MAVNPMYDDNIVSINAIRKQVEGFITSNERPEKRSFVSIIEQELSELAELRETIATLTLTHSSEFIRLCNHIDRILITIQALLEADRYTVSTVLNRELGDNHLFNKLFGKSAENYAAINRKLNYLSEIVRQLEKKEVKSKEDIHRHVESIYGHIELLKKEGEQYGDALYGKLYRILEDVKNQNLNTHKELQDKYNEIIDLIKGEKNDIDREGIVKTFEPLVRDLIETELNQKGKFISLLTDKIVELSEQKDTEIQNQFRLIVESLVGKGTQSNERIARENTIKGLKTLSEADVDEVLGRKLISIVEKKSGVGDTLAKIGDKINKILTFGGRDDTAKKFFDGFSFSIYYSHFIINDIQIMNELLPEKITSTKLEYINKFTQKINEWENLVKENPDEFEAYEKNIPQEINIETEELILFIKFTKYGRSYFFLSQEPSIFFKEQVEKILLKKINDKDIDKVRNDIKELTENYTIPKVELAVFNSKDFVLPSDDGKSVIASKSGAALLKEEFKKELLDIIGDIKIFFNNNNKGIKGFFRKKENYTASKGNWYFWAINKSGKYKKYLAVKLFRPLSRDNMINKKISEKERFINFVTANIWTKIISTKSLSEMQDWINTFVQKDAGVLGDNRILFRIISSIEKASLYLLVIIFALVFIVYISKPGLLLPDLRAKIDEINSNFIRLEQRIIQFSYIYRNETSHIQNRISNLEKLHEVHKPENHDNDLILIEDTYKPFIFDRRKTTQVEELSQGDYIRLTRIVKNLLESTNKWVIFIIRYNNVEDKWNLERANNVKEFLIKHNISEDIIKISDEIDQLKLRGIRINLIKKEM